MGAMEPRYQLEDSIDRKDLPALRAICQAHPSLVSDHMPDPDDPNSRQKRAWTCYAANQGDQSVLEAMLGIGFNINAANLPQVDTAIDIAIYKSNIELVRWLLSRGANPNIGRPVISAMNCDDPSLRLSLVRLLIEHGLDVNNRFELYGDKTKLFTALDWAKDPKIAELLKSHGAKHAKELADAAAEPKASVGAAAVTAKPGPAAPQSPAAAVVAHFAKHFGPVEERSFIEIVPSGQPIAVHVIKAGSKRRHVTLFTTGLSAQPMQVPPGQEEFALAELFMQLPGDWKYHDLGNPVWGWPVHWLRKIAQYPGNHKTWLGGPLAIIANDDPPQPLAPNTRMTSLLLLAESSFLRGDDKQVRLYRVTPLYTEERELELRQGAAALMRAFDRKSVPYIVDIKRSSVA